MDLYWIRIQWGLRIQSRNPDPGGQKSINHPIIHNEKIIQSEKFQQEKQKFARCHKNDANRLSFMSINTSVSDPDQTQSGQWIRIPIQEGKNDPQK